MDYLETWEGMEECVKLGLTKSIGISNFNESQIDRLLKQCNIKPVVNQVEVNPNNNQKTLIQFCQDHDIHITAFCPLERGGDSKTPGYPSSSMSDPKVIEIAKKYGKTPAQVVLRYLVSDNTNDMFAILIFSVTVVTRRVSYSKIRQ